ncbi:restriction endonuclease subunit S [Calditerrivibrio nitroreducens]|uniref:Restriction modification system DNA specificity domain n=1 Tax=Calditerrivibrio nitroreducens (strain DSM 19672 / NBRC 101217 / Yu37-1) TaxID=768670 RepID=E4TFM2_CALNY|nr:restriction endonuclease subunit S [Calditerrivibrio nitroreducens]ADR18490.1 restriction modification system DNA specificity domain [Calditerrivibrio nitroreducens DSM 19672]
MSEKIPEGWKRVKLGEVIEIITGGTPKTSVPEYWNGDIPWLSITDFNNGRKYCYNAEKKITEKGLKESTTNILKKGQIIISARGTVGVISMLGRDMAFNQSCYGINAKAGLTFNDFIYYLLKFNIPHFISNSYGAVFDTITKQTFEQIIIKLPPLPEQKAIASVLSSLDDKIDLLHRQNQTLEKMAETLFRKWFIEDAKDDWEEVSLGNSELSTIINSGIDKFEGEKIYLATGDVQDTNITGGIKITYENRPSRANMQPVKFSVWFAKKGGVRKLLMFDDYSDINKYILSTGFSGLKTNELSHYYIWCFILTKEFQEIKDSFVSGSVQPDITNEGIKQITILRPDDQTLINFNKIMKPLFYKCQQNKLQIRTLENLRDTLLPKLMSGEVRVKCEV